MTGTATAMLNALRWIENAFAVAAGATMAAIMVLVSADAIGRYFFHAPVSIQFELTQNHLLVMATVLAFGWGTREGVHIQVSFLADRLPAGVQRVITAAGSLATAALFAGVTWYSWLGVAEAWRNDEMVMGVIDWPVVYSRIWVPLGAGLMTLRLIATAMQALRQSVEPAAGAVVVDESGTPLVNR